jgi:transposase
MREMPVKRAGEILCESDSRIWGMLFAHLKAAYERLSLENVVWVGADAINRRKGENCLMVFADLLAKRVIFKASMNGRMWGKSGSCSANSARGCGQ